MERLQIGGRADLDNPHEVRQGKARCRFGFFQIEVVVDRQVIKGDDAVLVRDLFRPRRYLCRMFRFDNVKVPTQGGPELKLSAGQGLSVFFFGLLNREEGGSAIVPDHVGPRSRVYCGAGHNIGIIALFALAEAGDDGSVIGGLAIRDLRVCSRMYFGRLSEEGQLAGELIVVNL